MKSHGGGVLFKAFSAAEKTQKPFGRLSALGMQGKESAEGVGLPRSHREAPPTSQLLPRTIPIQKHLVRPPQNEFSCGARLGFEHRVGPNTGVPLPWRCVRSLVAPQPNIFEWGGEHFGSCKGSLCKPISLYKLKTMGVRAVSCVCVSMCACLHRVNTLSRLQL